MFSIFAIASLVCLSVLCVDFSAIITVDNLMFNGICWNLLGVFDYVSISILLMLIICFGYASYYTPHYFSGDSIGGELYSIICVFVGVMATLVLTGDLLSTLVFWEWLGVVSYFLIVFYLNYLSLRSSVVTLVSSRFGDVCLFVLIAVWLYTGALNTYLCLILYFFVIFTKSAGFPFISWLLEAMRAPTPVSSLVHSSTLVAAGVWFSMRYDANYFFSNSLLFSLLLLITIFITGVCCFFFLDLKKIVALSTCNNIAWCIFYLLFGDVVLSLFQLVTHGVSKCLLFMLVGDIMSGTGGSQASNCVYASRLYGNSGIFGLFSIILGLSGVPFIGVFFTKHFLLSEFGGVLNIIIFTFVLFCVFLSYFYSFRLCVILINIKSSMNAGVLFFFNSGVMIYAWLFINYFLFYLFDETMSLSYIISSYLILFQLVACVTACFYYNDNTSTSWSSSLFGCDNLVEGSYLSYYMVNSITALFFFRWDSEVLGLFRGHGSEYVNSNVHGLLNFIMLWLVLFLVVWCIFFV